MAEAVDIFNEKSTRFTNLAFRDENGNAVVPDSATYTLYDEETEKIINSRNATPIASLAASVDLELEPDDNVLVDSDKHMEAHILFVAWIYNTNKVGHDEFRFWVRNLTKVT